MHERPEQSFNCGPFSLYRVRAAAGVADPAHALIHQERCTTNGTSLYQVWVLANRLGMNYQLAKRLPGAEIPLPCIAHWNQEHFSALTRFDSELHTPTKARVMPRIL